MNEFESLFDVSGLSLNRLHSFLQIVEADGQEKAAMGDPIKQSQFSWQIKEMEEFFGVARTRRVGRWIEITAEGKRLAMIIRRQFRDLDDFREPMACRSVSVRIGSQRSVIDWLLVPRLAEIHKALGNAMVELEQLRTAEVLRAVTDVARAVQASHAAAVLPDLATVGCDPKTFKWERINTLKPRTMVLIANARSLDRIGIHASAAEQLAKQMKLS